MCLFFTIKLNRTFHSKKNELFILAWEITSKKKRTEKLKEGPSLFKQHEEVGEMTPCKECSKSRKAQTGLISDSSVLANMS